MASATHTVGSDIDEQTPRQLKSNYALPPAFSQALAEISVAEEPAQLPRHRPVLRQGHHPPPLDRRDPAPGRDGTALRTHGGQGRGGRGGARRRGRGACPAGGAIDLPEPRQVPVHLLRSRHHRLGGRRAPARRAGPFLRAPAGGRQPAGAARALERRPGDRGGAGGAVPGGGAGGHRAVPRRAAGGGRPARPGAHGEWNDGLHSVGGVRRHLVQLVAAAGHLHRRAQRQQGGGLRYAGAARVSSPSAPSSRCGRRWPRWRRCRARGWTSRGRSGG